MTSVTTNPAIEQAMASVAAAAARAAQDPLRPVYHFHPPANWMNDPNGTIYAGGYFHLFYQHNPYGDQWGHMHWGHARSRDLVHWEHLPIALWPSHELGEEHCFSGCAVVRGDDRPMLIYTKVGPGERGQRPPNEQWAALGSDDWITWEKHPDNPILALETHGGPPYAGPWRDPFVFEIEDRRFLVLGGDYDDVTSVALYEAEDDTYARWRYRGELASAPRTGPTFLECPNFFWVDDQWVLLTSPYRPVEYQVGDFDPDAATFTPATSGVLDPGWRPNHSPAHFYATNIAYAPDGRCILFGWVRGFPADKGWNGCLALPRVLTIGPDRRPRQQPIAELADLRSRHQRFAAAELPAGTTVIATALTTRAEIDLTLVPPAAGTVELTLRAQDAGVPSLSVRYDGRELRLSHTVVPLELAPGTPLRLRLFVDRAVVELFVNDGAVAITTVEELPVGLVDVEVTTSTKGTQLVSFDAWDLMPVMA